MRFTLALLIPALAAVADALKGDPPARLDRLEKRGGGSLHMGLIVANPKEAKAWSKYAHKFSNQINYSPDISSHARVKSVAFMPMRRKGQSGAQFKKEATASIKAGAKYITSMNEPNQRGVSGKSAAKDWKKYILPLLKKYPHVKGVAGNISANDKGVKFISDFRKSCRGCRVSRYSFHWYNKAGRSVSDGMRKLKEFTHQVEKAAGGTKLMVTEFMARTSKTSQQRDLLKKAVAFFKSSSKITDCFAFPNVKNAAFTRGTSLTSIGKYWAGLA